MPQGTNEGDAQIVLDDLARTLECLTGAEEGTVSWLTRGGGGRVLVLSPGELAGLLRSAAAGSADEMVSACEQAQDKLWGHTPIR